MLRKGLAAWAAAVHAQHSWAPTLAALERGWMVSHPKTPTPLNAFHIQTRAAASGRQGVHAAGIQQQQWGNQVSPQLLSLADPSEQWHEGIRAKSEVTLHFSAARSPQHGPCSSSWCADVSNSPAHHVQGKGLSTRLATGTSVRQWQNGESRKNTGKKGSTPNCLGLKSW